MSLTLAANSAEAGIGSLTILRSWATGVCVDSNYAGSAYAIGCNGGNFQNWFIGGYGLWACGAYGCGPVVGLRSNETNLVLDSNWAGAVYTHVYVPDNDANQEWLMTGNDTVTQFQDVATGLCLHTNGDGALFTTGCGSNFQDWRQGF
jgi:serine/threonine-protein kinase